MIGDIARKVVAGLVVLAIGTFVGKVYADRTASAQVRDFQAKAEALIGQERYGEVYELGKSLPERVRNDNRVEFTLIKARVFGSALKSRHFWRIRQGQGQRSKGGC